MSTPHVSSPDYHGKLRALSAEVQQKVDIAVLRERERCAKIADEEIAAWGDCEIYAGIEAATSIATRIRKG